MGCSSQDWHSVSEVLGLFTARVGMTKRRYREFVALGVEDKQAEVLLGGSLVRSNGGWEAPCVSCLTQTTSAMGKDCGTCTKHVINPTKSRQVHAINNNLKTITYRITQAWLSYCILFNSGQSDQTDS